MPDETELITTDTGRAIAALARGELVGLPTETVYGLAADATDERAVARVFAAKERPTFDPLIVHVADLAMAETVGELDDRARQLVDRCWPGPLTVLVPRRTAVPDLVTSGLPTVGLRCPDHPLALTVIRGLGRPVAAPSANRFGSLSPTCAAAVVDQLGAHVACVLDGGDCRVGVESTVLRLHPEPLVLRPGGVALEELEDLLGTRVPLAARAERAASLPIEAPGMLASHYAPRTPLRFRGAAWSTDPAVGRLLWTTPDHRLPGPCEVLTPTGDAAEAATRLFAALRRLDQAGLSAIEVEPVPDQGLGRAINDRLRRAAGLG